MGFCKLPLPFYPGHILSICAVIACIFFLPPYSPFKIPVVFHGHLPISYFVCPLLQSSLEFYPSQRMGTSIILWRNGYDNRAIGILPIPPAITHSVYRQMAFLGRSIYHIAARTHAKRIYPSPILCLCCYFICCRRKVSRPFHTILNRIYQFLRMLRPQPYGKSFRFHRYLSFIQHLKSIPGAMPNSQHGHIRFYPRFFSFSLFPFFPFFHY